jgi:hypothetical protein
MSCYTEEYHLKIVFLIHHLLSCFTTIIDGRAAQWLTKHETT